MISVRVPATSANLGPGYDAVGLALSLSMRIGLDRSPHPEIEIRGTGAGLIPRGPEHPAYRAARFVAELVGESNVHFRLVQENDIPPTRGLGGSAAALVGGAVAANELFGGQIAPPDLLNIVCELDGHPDNAAPALLGGLVIGTLTPVGVSAVRLEPKGLKVGRRRPRLRRLDHGGPPRPPRLRPPPRRRLQRRPLRAATRRPRDRRVPPPARRHAGQAAPTLPLPPHPRPRRRHRGGARQRRLRRLPLRLGPHRPRLRPRRTGNDHSLWRCRAPSRRGASRRSPGRSTLTSPGPASSRRTRAACKEVFTPLCKLSAPQPVFRSWKAETGRLARQRC